MKRIDRVLSAIYLEEPDTVPITEMEIDPLILERVTGDKYIAPGDKAELSPEQVNRHNAEVKVKCYGMLDKDAIGLYEADRWVRKKFPDGSIMDEWGRIWNYEPAQKKYWLKTGTIKTPEDLDKLEPPDPLAPARLSLLQNVVRLTREKSPDNPMAVMGEVNAPLVVVWEAMGMDRFMYSLATNLPFVKRFVEYVTDHYYVPLIKAMIDMEIHLLLEVGDYADKKGLFFHPKYFHEIVYPSLRRLVNAAHKRGVPFIKHSDGNLNAVIGDFIKETNLDGFGPLEPRAGMDFGELKEKHGGKVCLVGNVDCAHTLTYKTTNETVAETKDVIRKASPGGGHVLSSSNSFHSGVKLENCYAMHETGRKYGRYTLRER